MGSASNNALVVPFLARWLDNLRADQLPDGRIPIFSPRSPFDAEAAAGAQGVGSIVAAAGWSDAIATVPWTLYERFGDRRVLKENYDAMVSWIEYQRVTAAAELPDSLADVALSADRRRAQALLYNSGLHFGDWLTPTTMESGPLHEAIMIAPTLTSEYVAPMFQAQTLTLASRAAGVLGREADAADFAARAASVRAAFAAEYVDAGGDLPVRLQGVYVLASRSTWCLRLCGPHRCPARRARARARRPARHRLPLDAAPARCAVRHAAIPRSRAPCCGSPRCRRGSTRSTTARRRSGRRGTPISPDGVIRPMSFNHYAPGSVDDWLYRRVAGIRSTSPGYRTAVIEPDFEIGVDHVAAHVGTPYGRLAVEWTRTGDAASVVVDVPFGVEATLVSRGSDGAPRAGPQHPHGPFRRRTRIVAFTPCRDESRSLNSTSPP